jgi:predicted nucleic acid-binding protein
MYAYLANQTKPLFDKLKKMKFESPKQSKKELLAFFQEFME